MKVDISPNLPPSRGCTAAAESGEASPGLGNWMGILSCRSITGGLLVEVGRSGAAADANAGPARGRQGVSAAGPRATAHPLQTRRRPGHGALTVRSDEWPGTSGFDSQEAR